MIQKRAHCIPPRTDRPSCENGQMICNRDKLKTADPAILSLGSSSAVNVGICDSLLAFLGMAGEPINLDCRVGDPWIHEKREDSCLENPDPFYASQPNREG